MFVVFLLLGTVMFPGSYAAASEAGGENDTGNNGSASTNGVGSNLSGWTAKDKGTIEETPEGLKLSSAENGFALSAEQGESFSYEADVTLLQDSGVVSLVFRSNDSGWGSYMAQLDPGADILKLKDANGDRVLKMESVTLSAGETYHLKVTAEGPSLKVYWNGGAEPLLAALDTAYTSGYFGMHVWNSAAVFQNIHMEVMNTETKPGTVNSNLSGWAAKDKGTIEETPEGLKLSSAENGFALSAEQGESFSYEADVTLLQDSGVVSLVFRSNDSGWSSYMAQLDPGADILKLKDTNGDRVLKTESVTLSAGETYHLKVTAEGASLKVYWNGGAEPLLEAEDTAYTGGYFGMHVWNSAAVFQNIYAGQPGKAEPVEMAGVSSNLTGWSQRGVGTASSNLEGLQLTASGEATVMSETYAQDFTYESDVTLKSADSAGSLLLRSDETGRNGFLVQVDGKAGKIRLLDANSAHPDRLWIEKSIAVLPDVSYHVKVKADGKRIKVYWNGKYDPIISAETELYSDNRRLGLRASGTTVFQNIEVSDLLTNIEELNTEASGWMKDLQGLKGTSEGAQWSLHLFGSEAKDFVLESNVTIAVYSPSAEAALLFRANEDGSGYWLQLNANEGTVKLVKSGSAGREVLASTSDIPLAPGKKHHIEIHAAGSQISAYVDGYKGAAAQLEDTGYASGLTGLAVTGGSAYFQDVYLTPSVGYYNEIYRPAYHYTPARGSASDPNGLVYFEGEYHLFHQSAGQWAHAVSTDLVHWRRLPLALNWNDLGHVWSGAAIADEHNASGLFGDSGGKGLVAYYTSFNPDKTGGNQQIGLAYSKDKGRTWQYYGNEAIIKNPGYTSGNEPVVWDFRDPKVVRDEAGNRWIMVVSGGDHIRFYTSENLIDWTLTDSFGYGSYIRGGVWECPDLFPLKVDGDASKQKWVLMISMGANPKTTGSDAEYFIGELTPDGKFVNDNPPGTVLRTDFGKEMYAATSFANVPGNRRIMLAWMTNWDYPFSFPTSPWKGQMTIPRELSLRTTPEGIRLAQNPIAELEVLRGTPFTVSDTDVSSDTENILAPSFGNAYEIEAELELPEKRAASEFGFRLREGGAQRTVVGYRTGSGKLFVDRSASGRTDFSSKFSSVHEAKVQPENSALKLHILVDESSVEVFAADGRTVFSDVIFPDKARSGMSFYAKGGTVKVKSIKVYPLKNIWNEGLQPDASAGRIILDRSLLELGAGESKEIFAGVQPHESAQELVWTSGDESVVTAAPSGSASAVLKAVAPGTAAVTVKTRDGSVSAVITVTVGTFNTNLKNWKANSSWAVTSEGIRGTFDTDSSYMSGERAADFTYEADVMLPRTGGAGSILFRSNADGTSGYYFNLDPNLKLARLFYMADGQFQDRQVLAKVPMALTTGVKHHAKITAAGTRITIELDGRRIIDVDDDTFRQGTFGVNVFGGDAYYQNVNVSDTIPADDTLYSFVNAGTGAALTADSQSSLAKLKALPQQETINQYWSYYPIKNNTYTIRTGESGKSLDWDTGANTIQLYAYLGYDNQRWLVHNNADGTITILSKFKPDKALEAREDGTVGLENANGSALQKWRAVKVEAGGQQPSPLPSAAPSAAPSAVTSAAPSAGESAAPSATPSATPPAEPIPAPAPTPSPVQQPDIGVTGTADQAAASFFSAAKTEQGDRSVLEIKLDKAALEQLAADKAADLQIKVSGKEDVVVGGLSAAEWNRLFQGGSRLTVSTPELIVPLPVLSLGDSIEGLGAGARAEDIGVRLSIEHSPAASDAEKTAASQGYRLLANPLAVKLTLSYKDKSVSAPLKAPVELLITVPAEQAGTQGGIAAVTVQDEGKLFAVPASLKTVDHIRYAVIHEAAGYRTYALLSGRTSFSDTRNHWVQGIAADLADRMMLTGGGDGRFAPDRTVTRAELAALSVRSLGLMGGKIPSAAFSDVPASSWAYGPTALAQRFGLMSGYPGGVFGGSGEVTREQAMMVAYNAVRLIQGGGAAPDAAKTTSSLSSFADRTELSSWASEAAAYLIDSGIVKGDGSRELRPKDTLTRAEAAALIHRMLQANGWID
ncbi:GH32 C-terminal domain-containing protein [Paenibacillus durus]|uniref:GH32 C-terminal domain-containing protein n=5 Tax=Paenibacillus durus TaxID=44251 RepID=UPI0009E37E62|nr:GH32 C-terminal domain-containing protein [Paenibacillus durus]